MRRNEASAQPVCLCVVAVAPRKQQHADGGRGLLLFWSPPNISPQWCCVEALRVLLVFSSSHPASLSRSSKEYYLLFLRLILSSERASDSTPMTHDSDQKATQRVTGKKKILFFYRLFFPFLDYGRTATVRKIVRKIRRS